MTGTQQQESILKSVADRCGVTVEAMREKGRGPGTKAAAPARQVAAYLLCRGLSMTHGEVAELLGRDKVRGRSWASELVLYCESKPDRLALGREMLAELRQEQG